LEELSRGVNVQEESVGQALHLACVPGPHVELVLGDRLLVLSVEELRQAADLLVVLLRETVFHDLVDEVHHCTQMSLLAKLIGLLIEGEGLER